MSVVDTIVNTVLDQLRHAPRAIVAVSGPQGSGKTTATKWAADVLATKHNIPVMAISLDDFYKPYSELQEVAKGGNPLLRHRGLPGTHDVALASQFLHDFKAENVNLQVPVYDKSLHNGAGDRCGFAEVPSSTVAVLLEGWMVGFKPVGRQNIKGLASAIGQQPWSVKPSTANLLEIEQNLEDYVPLWALCDGFVRIMPQKLAFVYHWRLQQEHDLWKSRGSGMSDTEVLHFVDQYMPCYFIYNRTLPKASVVLDTDHNPTEALD